MDQTGEFIDLFRRLEAALRENALTGSGPREFNSMINALARQDPFIQDRWNEIDLCRQIRNILSHFPTVQGRRPLVPDQALLDVLTETIEHLEHPVRAIDAARAREHLYTVVMESPAQPTLWQMRKRGFSHVPVMEEDMYIYPHLETIRDLIHSGELVNAAEQAVGELKMR